MNVELFMYFKQYLLGMFKVSHLVEEVTARLLDMNSGPIFPFSSDFFFLSFAVPRFYGFFFNVCGQHCFYSLNYCVTRREQAKHIG